MDTFRNFYDDADACGFSLLFLLLCSFSGERFGILFYLLLVGDDSKTPPFY